MRRLPAVWALTLALASPARADDATEDEDERGALPNEAAPAAESAPIAEVIVSGLASPARERSDPTPAVFVLEGDELTMPGRSTADTFATAVGAQVTRRGGNADLATLSLRGGTNAQTPIYLAGVQLNDELTGSVDLSTLPLFLLHRVELYRGHAPLAADELGFGGAVMLEPRRPARDQPVRAQGALGVGSFGQRFGRAALSIGGPRAGASLSIARHAATDDYTFLDDGGTRFDPSDDVVRRRTNADYQDTDVWALGHVAVAPVALSLVVSGWERDAGAPGLQLIGAEEARAHRRRWLAGLGATIGTPSDRWMLELDGGTLAARYRLEDPARELGFSRSVENRGDRHHQRVRLTWRPLPLAAFTLGASYTRASLHIDADERALERASRDRLRSALSALAEPVEGLALSGVVDLTRQETQSGGLAQALLVPAARLGARYRILEQLAVFANVGRYARVATLGELYGVTAGSLGNPELTPELGWSADAGLGSELSIGAISAYGQLVGFVRVADDLIAYRRSALGVIRPYNIGSARLFGLEALAGASFFHTVVATLALTALEPRDVSDERTTDADLIPLLSRLTFTPRLEVRSPRWPLIALQRASAGASVAYRSSRVADPAGLIVLEEQARLDLDVALAFADRLTVRARMENVLDSETYDLVGYPLAGRSLFATAEVEL